MKSALIILSNFYNRFSTRLTVVFLLLSLLPLAFVGYLTFVSQRQTIEQNMISHLTSITLLKEAEFNRWIEDKTHTLEGLAMDPDVQDNTAILAVNVLDSPEHQSIRTSIREDHFESSIEIEGDWLELFLLQAKDGLIFISSNQEREGMFQKSQPYFVEGQRATFVQNVYYSLILEEAAMTIGTPVMDEEGNVIAVLAGRVNLKEMSKIMTQGTGLSETEETYLVNKFNFWVTESRFGTGYALKKAIHTEGVEECLAHIDGKGLYDDYRGVPVIGVYRWIPERELCILTQVDQAEAFEPITTLLREMVVTGSGVTLIVVFLAIVFSRTITEPVQELVEGVEEIGQGNLDHKIEIRSRDEIGHLADAFNLMSAKRKQARDALRESEENLRATLYGIGDGVIATDFDGRIVRMNPVAEELTGWKLEEAQGKSLDEVFPIFSEKTGEKVENPVERVKREGLIVGLANDTILTSKDGVEIPIADSGAPIFNAEGELSGVVLIFRDQTEERQAEKELKEYSVRLEETLAELNAAQNLIIQQERLSAVGQLATGIAHDFNNILVPITLYSEALLNEPGLPRHAKERLRIILRQASLAASFIEQILDFSRKSVLEVSNLELVGLLLEIEKLLVRTLPETISVELIGDSEKYVIQADSARMQQMFLNLALNSRDAMPDGGQLRIELSPLQIGRKDPPPFLDIPPGEWVQLEVIDTGVGIQAEDLPHIFEPFFTTKEVGEGVGLGLAQVYGIVKQHGGYIDVKSEVGEGTTCVIYLPLVSAEPEVGPKDITAIQVKGKGETILVVEDDEFVQQALCEILEMLGYRVLATTRSLEALEIFERETIDLVLSDLVMPDMGGVQLYKSLRERDPEVKMVVISGYPIEDEGRLLIEQGILAWIQKPPDLRSISEAIHSVFEVKVE